MNSNETVLSGKEMAKLNKRKSFYSKLERQISQSENEKKDDLYFPIKFHKQIVFPEYDDLTLIINDFAELIKDLDEESKGSSISLPDLDEGHFLKNMSKSGLIELFKEEVFENADGTIRKGSTGSIDDYNYQSAFNFFVKVVDEDKFLKKIEKEKEDPTTYDIPVKTKKIEKKKYVKTYRYPRRRRR